MTNSFDNLRSFRAVMYDQLPSESSRRVIIDAIDSVISEGKI